MRHLRRALAFVLIWPAAACGAVEGDERARETLTELTITVRQTADAPPRRFELACEPPRGSHPQPTKACAVARRAGADAFAPVPPDTLCIEIYGGPQTARVEGVVLGVQVDAGFARTNGCEIERWDRLRPLVPLHSDERGARPYDLLGSRESHSGHA